MLPRGKSTPSVSRFSNFLRGYNAGLVGSYLLIFNILTTISVKVLAEQNTFVSQSWPTTASWKPLAWKSRQVHFMQGNPYK